MRKLIISNKLYKTSSKEVRAFFLTTVKLEFFCIKKKVILITRIHNQLCQQPYLRVRALRRWGAWAVYPPTDVFPPGQV